MNFANASSGVRKGKNITRMLSRYWVTLAVLMKDFAIVNDRDRRLLSPSQLTQVAISFETKRMIIPGMLMTVFLAMTFIRPKNPFLR